MSEKDAPKQEATLLKEIPEDLQKEVDKTRFASVAFVKALVEEKLSTPNTEISVSEALSIAVSFVNNQKNNGNHCLEDLEKAIERVLLKVLNEAAPAAK